jgi:hypothetical protein
MSLCIIYDLIIHATIFIAHGIQLFRVRREYHSVQNRVAATSWFIQANALTVQCTFSQHPGPNIISYKQRGGAPMYET